MNNDENNNISELDENVELEIEEEVEELDEEVEEIDDENSLLEEDDSEISEEEDDENVEEADSEETDVLGGLLGQPDQRVGLKTDVDIVFVIDATASMGPFMDKVKEDAMSFMDNLDARLKEGRRITRNIRLKVIAYRDYYYDFVPLMESNFFLVKDNGTNVEEELKEFRDFVKTINPDGGEDEPESGLEALYFLCLTLAT